MAKYLTSNTLIDSVKRRASIPESQSTFLEADFLAFANEEMDIGIIPHVLSFHEEYFVYTELVALEANISRYPIPTRAVGSKLRELAYQDDNGSIFEMTRIKIDDLPDYMAGSSNNASTCFYVEGNDIVITPDVGANPSGYLRFSYYLRPNEIVSESRVAIITAINRTSGEITVDTVPSNIIVSELIDFVQTKPPHKTLGLDVTIASINSTTNVFTFETTDIPSGLSVGDQVALAGESIVPQIPSDLHSMLSQRVAARCLESLGDTNGLSAANTKLAEMEQKTGTLIQDRVQGAPLKVIAKNSALRKKSGRWF